MRKAARLYGVNALMNKPTFIKRPKEAQYEKNCSRIFGMYRVERSIGQ